MTGLRLVVTGAGRTVRAYLADVQPAAKVMAYTYLTPSWVILWEIALGKPVPSGLVLLGVAATITALAMLVRE